VQVWQPWDTPSAVQRFLAHFQPRVGLLVETEVWPNMVAACAKDHLPLCLVNARMSEKSLKQALRLAWLAGPAYAGLARRVGANSRRCQATGPVGCAGAGVTGNFKFDATPDACSLRKGRLGAQLWRNRW
jgi:3-deoxy-D-manno-octulosonic-acid transferase